MTSVINTFVQACSDIALSVVERRNDDTYHPKLEEILKNCCCNEYAVQHGERKKKKEILVVGKTNAVVNPERKKKP